MLFNKFQLKANVSMSNKKEYSIDTQCVKEHEIHASGQSHVAPIHATSSYSYRNVQDSIDVFTKKKKGFVYSRFSNPTVKDVEDKLAKLESYGSTTEAACIMTSSGLSAISTFALSMLEKGDEVLTQPDLYGGSTEIFSKIVAKNGIKIHTIDLTNLDLVESTLKANPSIKIVYFETPSNPMLKVVDIASLAQLAKKYDAYSAIDNTFATFYLQKPLQLGVDFVLYSATKYLNGHGNAISGAMITKNPEHREKLWVTMKLLGTNSNAWDAWLLHNGLKTLSVRMDRHCSNAMAIAEYLETLTSVNKVNYPGLTSHPTHQVAKSQMAQFGGMLSFELAGGMDSAIHFMDSTELCTIAATLGNVDTLLLHPATSSHLFVAKEIRDASGIKDGLVRISVGIENIEDLKADIDQALSSLT